MSEWRSASEKPTSPDVVEVVVFDAEKEGTRRFFMAYGRYHADGLQGHPGWRVEGYFGGFIRDDGKGRYSAKSILCWRPLDPPGNIALFCPLCHGAGYTGASSALTECDCQMWATEMRAGWEVTR